MKKLLLVDDELEVLEAYRDMIDRSLPNVKVFISDNPADALEIINMYDVGTVITDFKMPKVNGLNLSRRMLALNPKLDIFIMSAYLKESMENDLHLLGVRKILEKPIYSKDLISLLKENQIV